MTTHDLKIHPAWFEAVANNTKTFELRHNDRDFKVGDMLCLREWVPTGEAAATGEYTGRTLYRSVTFILHGNSGLDISVALPQGWCILSLGGYL